MNEWIDWFANLTLIKILLVAGGVFAGVFGFVRIFRLMKGDLRNARKLHLQYVPLQAMIAPGKRGAPTRIDIRTRLENQEDEPITIRPVRLLCTFGEHNNAKSELPDYEPQLGAKCRNLILHAPPVVLPRPSGNQVVRGRIDWLLEFWPSDNKTRGSIQRYVIKGNIEIHKMMLKGGKFAESRWGPDQDSEFPLVGEEIYVDDAGEFHSYDPSV